MRVELRDDDLVRTFSCPDERGPFPPVLTLGGSDGCISEVYLNLLVPEGFACLAARSRESRGHRRGAAIPIERATGPILLISGGDDHMWPAARMCGMAMDAWRDTDAPAQSVI